jgi:hypothetical protein
MAENVKKRIIVISGVNLFEGGTLSILRECLLYANDCLSKDFEIIAIVHNKNYLPLETLNRINFIEFSNSRKSYLFRLYYEYFYFNKLSKKWDPYLWFSLHDTTPNVKAFIRAVYCHNPSPFKKIKFSDLFFQPALFFFSLFYKYLYRINIKKNDFVVVQQNWLKDKFVELFHVKSDNVLVCYPEVKKNNIIKLESVKTKNDVFTFFYPALARPFKNFEIIGEAIHILNNKGKFNYKVVITIDGSENNYAKYILNKFSNLKQLHFVGILSFNKVQEYYSITDALLFPSTLETWGLPITEFKTFNKTILLSNLPYAIETLGDYEKAVFFNPYDATDLAMKMEGLIQGRVLFDKTLKNNENVLVGWADLFDKLLSRY